MKTFVILAMSAFIFSSSSLAQIEVGKVKWKRDFDGTLAKSKKSGKPVLVLFQEVPG